MTIASSSEAQRRRGDGLIRGELATFDAHGRAVPAHLQAPAHQRTRRHFLCCQPAIEYGEIHRRTLAALGVEGAIPVSEFAARAEVVLEVLRSDPGTANVLNGVHVPFLLPPAAGTDPGEALEAWVEGVRRAFVERFPARTFTNHHKGGLAGRLAVVPGSRHDRLLRSVREGWVVGHYFPCLGEYSVPAAIEQVRRLPECFLLAGGIDTAAALVGSPDLLVRTDGYPPLLWLAALQGERAGVGYHFEAYGYDLTFNRRVHLGQAAESWASGLVVTG
jgi:hypothetical protein